MAEIKQNKDKKAAAETPVVPNVTMTADMMASLVASQVEKAVAAATANTPAQKGKTDLDREDIALTRELDGRGRGIIQNRIAEYNKRVKENDRVVKFRYSKHFGKIRGAHASLFVNLLKYTFQAGESTMVLEEDLDIVYAWVDETNRAQGTEVSKDGALEAATLTAEEPNSSYTLKT